MKTLQLTSPLSLPKVNDLRVCLWRTGPRLRARSFKVLALGLLVCMQIPILAASPRLEIIPGQTNVLLRWPKAQTNYVLECSSQLSAIDSWNVVTQPPSEVGTNFVVSDSLTNQSVRFFRLREKFDFYGRRIGLLKLFGKTKWGECSTFGPVSATNVYHAAGVLVDRSSEPNHIYVADTGNNRILGFRYFGTTEQPMIFGQPDEFSGAANGDSNIGMFGPTTASNLCLFAVPMSPNLEEQWHYINFDTDAEGNLYVPDIGNNRILVYYSPFSLDKSGGKGDTIADFVIGQDNFRDNGENRGMGQNQRDSRSLFIGFSGFGLGGISRGVSVDGQGNAWVADTANSRVLRFPHGSGTADLVIGQPDFATSVRASVPDNDPYKLPTNRLCSPTLARVNPETGDLFVIDEFASEALARILVFSAPFTNGMPASRVILPKQPLAGDYAFGYQFKEASGLIFNTFKTDDSLAPDSPGNHYSDGLFWVHAYSHRTLLLDIEGNILLTIGAPNATSFGGRPQDYCNPMWDPPYSLDGAGGMMGIDSSNHIFLASSAKSLVLRYQLPYQKSTPGTNVCLPSADGYLFGRPVLWLGVTNYDAGPAHIYYNNPNGCSAYKGQLFVQDRFRYMVWNDYLAKDSGSKADFFVGQANGVSIAHTPENDFINSSAKHAVDDRDRLWMLGGDSRLALYQLPFQANSLPLRRGIQLFWADNPTEEVDYVAYTALAFEPINRKLWVYDLSHYRLLRVSNPDGWAGKLLVDCVIGQTNKTGAAINRGLTAPDAASLTGVSDIRFDKAGNLFVVDNTYECHPNGRVMAFLAEDLASITGMFPAIQAKKLYVTQTFDQTDVCHWDRDVPFSPVAVAFNSRNEMVIGNDGSYRDSSLRTWRQLYLYRQPLIKSTPDAFIEVPLGGAGELTFDEHDNLIALDQTYGRLWVVNYDIDPGLLHPISSFTGGPAEFIAQPTNQIAVLGTNVIFNVEAVGPPPLSYQWLFNDSLIPGATGMALTLSNVQLTNDGNYRVTVSNPYGTVTSSVARLRVLTNNCIIGGTSLLGWWRGEGDAKDEIGFNHATIFPGVSFTNGLVGNAFRFNGSNSFVRLPQNLFPYPTNGAGNSPFSFEAWFQTSNGGIILGQQNALLFEDASGYVPALYIDAAGKVRAQLFWMNGVDQIVSAQSVNNGIFHHAAVTYDGTNEVLYLDGAIVGTKASTQSAYSGTYEYLLGNGVARNWPAAIEYYAFDGVIDEPAVHNRALSPAEVSAIYSAGAAGKYCNP